MTDVFREVDEALREDKAKAFWRRYGTYVIVLALLIVAAIAGWNLWTRYQTAQREEASDRLVQALDASRADSAAAIAQLTAVAEEAGAGQATIARLLEAGLTARAGDPKAAAALYRRVAADGSADRVWRDLATLLAVLHDLDSGDPVALTAELTPLTADGSSWRHSARELNGLLMLRQGKEADAAAQFAALAADDMAPPGIRQRAAELAALLGAPPAVEVSAS